MSVAGPSTAAEPRGVPGGSAAAPAASLGVQ